MDWEIQRGKRRKSEQATPRTKWWRLKEDNLKVHFREVLDKVRPVESVQEWCEETSTMILRVGQEVLGMASGRSPLGVKETVCSVRNRSISSVLFQFNLSFKLLAFTNCSFSACY